MDEDRATRTKRRALAKRATVVDRIKSVFDLGVSGESDLIARQKFLIAVNDLTDLWGKFVIENDAVLDALIDLGEEEQFSSSTEIETNDLLVSAKAMANRFSSSLNKAESPPEVPRCAMASEAAGSSDGPSKSSERQSLVTPLAQSSHSVRLPEIPLPRFEGELADWPVFRDRFVALVDSRSNISNIEKFLLLVKLLRVGGI